MEINGALVKGNGRAAQLGEHECLRRSLERTTQAMLGCRKETETGIVAWVSENNDRVAARVGTGTKPGTHERRANALSLCGGSDGERSKCPDHGSKPSRTDEDWTKGNVPENGTALGGNERNREGVRGTKIVNEPSLAVARENGEKQLANRGCMFGTLVLDVVHHGSLQDAGGDA